MGTDNSSGLRGIEVVEGVVLLEGVPAVYLRKHDAIVIADLHLGYEEAMARQGVFLPRLQLRRVRSVLEKARKHSGAETLIVAGDIKHEFGKLLRMEKLETAKFIRDSFRLGFKRIIVVRGNHDNYIGPIVKDLGGEFLEELELDDILVTHGHRRADIREYRVIIMGHEHPSLQVNIGGVKTKFPVLLKVPLDSGASAIVLPAAGSYQVGNNITGDPRLYLSPIIREHGLVENAIPIIVDEKEGLMVLPKISVMESIM